MCTKYPLFLCNKDMISLEIQLHHLTAYPFELFTGDIINLEIQLHHLTA